MKKVRHLEHRSQPVLPLRLFIRRLLHSFGILLALIVLSLAVGTLGYHVAGQLDWLDAFYNASMILSGMGPAGEMAPAAGKIFASFYALYSGLFLIAASGLLLAPVYHRMMHKFHMENKTKAGD